MNNNLTWLLVSAAAGLLVGAVVGRNLNAGGQRGVSGPDATGALHNQDMWYWINYHKKLREQEAAALQQPVALPTQQAMQQQGLAMQAQQQYEQNVPHYFF